MKKHLFVSVFILFIFLLKSSLSYSLGFQSTTKNDSTKIEQLLEEANNLISTNKINESIIVLEEVADLSNTINDFDKFLLSKSVLLKIYARYRVFEEADKIIKQCSKLIHKEEISNSSLGSYHIGMTWYLEGKGKLLEAIESVDKSLSYVSIDENPENYINYLIKKGTIYYQLDSKILAERTFLKSLELSESYLDKEHSYLSFIYNNLGAITADNYDYYKSELYYLKSLSLNQKKQNLSLLASTYNNLGNAYKNQEDYIKSLFYYKKSISLARDNNGNDLLFLAQTNLNIGSSFYWQGKFDSALYYFDKCIWFFENNELKNGALDLSKAKGNKSRIHALQKEPERAIDLGFEAMNIIEANYGKNNFEYIKAVINISNNYQFLDSLNKSLEWNQKALQYLISDFKPNSYFEVPKTSQFDKSTFGIGLRILGIRCLTLEKMYKKENKSECLEALVNASSLGANLLERLKEEDMSFWKKQSLNSVNSELYQYGIRAIFNQGSNLKESFKLLERYHINGVLENLSNSDVSIFENVPDSLLSLKSNLITEINYFQSQLHNNEDSLENYSQLYNSKNLLDSLDRHLIEEYPEFYAIKYEGIVSGVDDIQNKLLSEKQVLIEYFLDESYLYTYVINKHDFKVKRTVVDSSFFHSIDQLNDVITKNPTGRKNMQKDFDEFIANSFQLYKILIKPIEESIKEKQLIIIPDGALSLLPFEVLVENDSIYGYSYSQLKYLIKSHPISYAQSATFLLRLNREKKEKNSDPKILAFAPSYNKAYLKSENLLPLEWAEKEVGNISNYFNETSVVLKQNATEEEFFNQVGDYNIIHIASHGIIDNENPMYSKVLFSKNENDTLYDDFLHTFELYNLKLPTKMTVLSACNTGKGKRLKGEGVLSLANGFFYAGSESVLLSLWLADDQSTSVIMESFYKNLNDGSSKDIAIREAKLEYLNGAPVTKSHPYYWASFVASGDMSAITKRSFDSWYLIIVITMLIVVIASVLTYRFFNQKKLLS